MPFEDGTFDFVVCTSSLKSFSDPVTALREIWRVLNASGRDWISDMRHDVSRRTIREFVANEMKVKGLSAVLMRYTFERTLRPRASTAAQFSEMAKGIPYARVELKNNQMDFDALLER